MPPRSTRAAEDSEVAARVEQLVDDAARQRLPELFDRPRPDALYQVLNRHGVSATVLRTSDLGEDQLVKILQYRLAQYLMLAGFVSARAIYEAGIAHEPLASVGPEDVHVLVGSAGTGEILCYMTLRALADAPLGATMRTRERPLFVVERVFGWGIYDGMEILPDLPVARVRELSRFVKNQRLRGMDELAIRAPIEGCAATFQALIGPLRTEVAALVGDLEENVSKRNIEYFHVPTVVVRDAAPRLSDIPAPLSVHEFHPLRPFAFLAADLLMARPRLASVEAALAQPGRRCVAALLRLKRDTGMLRSGLLPPPRDRHDMRVRRRSQHSGAPGSIRAAGERDSR